MYPYPIIFGLGLYDICLSVGILACFCVFAALADRRKIKRTIQNFTLFCGAFSTVLGYGSAVLFQAFYNIKSLGRFEINESTGATFYGGLIGGVLSFLVLYFVLGRFVFGDKEHFASFFDIADSAVPGIALAHAIGRIGCLFAGCCHGARTNAWYGIDMYFKVNGEFVYGGKYVPVQLFESIFLFMLFGFLLIRATSKRSLGLPIYLSAYAVWRFFVEYIRDDYRGDTLTELLTPSQFTACILFVVGIAVAFLQVYAENRIASSRGLDKAKIPDEAPLKEDATDGSNE